MGGGGGQGERVLTPNSVEALNLALIDATLGILNFLQKLLKSIPFLSSFLFGVLSSIKMVVTTFVQTVLSTLGSSLSPWPY